MVSAHARRRVAGTTYYGAGGLLSAFAALHPKRVTPLFKGLLVITRTLTPTTKDEFFLVYQPVRDPNRRDSDDRVITSLPAAKVKLLLVPVWGLPILLERPSVKSEFSHKVTRSKPCCTSLATFAREAT